MPGQPTGQLRLRASPPTVPFGLVQRPRLDRQLNDGFRAGVTLVSAGPGAGKTVAVASWLTAVAHPAAWLCVDESDNDLRTFWTDVLGALAVGDVLSADHWLLELVPGTAFGSSEVRRIRAGLAELPRPVTLVLDEVHQLTDRTVLDSLSELIEQQPSTLRPVLLSRADPAVRLHRLRVAGGLTEIRAHELAFTQDEAAELFTRDGITLTADQLRALLDRTLGWSAGLRLAAMSAAGGDTAGAVARFTGTTTSVAEYLLGEVLDRQSQADRDFLLRTSIAERINAPLATVLTDRADSQSILEGMVAANAFVVGVGDPGTWFRYHPLLRELMQHRLALEQPGIADALHARASAWFAAQGDPIGAIRHATRAGDWDGVGRLLTGSALPLVLTPAGSALAAALEPAMRRSVHQPTLSTLLAAAIWHYQRHDFTAMRRDTIEAFELLAGTADDIRIPAEVLIAATTLTYHRAAASEQLAGSSARLLSVLERTPRRLVPAARHYRAIGLNNLGVAQLWAGNLIAAETNLTAGAEHAAELGMDLSEITARAHLAILDVIHGRLLRADRRAGAARPLVDRRGWASEPQALGLYVAAGMTQLAWDRSAEAADTIDAGLVASSRGSDTGCRLALGAAAVGVAVALGQADTARSAADRLAAELAGVPDPPDLLTRWCGVALAQAQLLSGDPHAAIRSINDPFEGSGFAAALERVTLAKAHLALGRPELLPALLDPVTGAPPVFLGPAVEARILLALAADRQRRDTAALTLITEAIDLAQPQGLIRPFLDAGASVTALLSRHRSLVGRHLDFTQQLTVTPPPRPHPPAAMIDNLTERELIVLRYLPTMLKAGEIGKDLYLSVNTVKSHMRAIYRKLDATNRRAAVERARELNLL